MQKDNGGNAFPQWVPEIMIQAEFGMSLRDYFAAKATKEDISDVRSDYYKANGWSPDREPLTNAQCRYMHADLMLAERAK